MCKSSVCFSHLSLSARAPHFAFADNGTEQTSWCFETRREYGDKLMHLYLILWTSLICLEVDHFPSFFGGHLIGKLTVCLKPPSRSNHCKGFLLRIQGCGLNPNHVIRVVALPHPLQGVGARMNSVKTRQLGHTSKSEPNVEVRESVDTENDLRRDSETRQLRKKR